MCLKAGFKARDRINIAIVVRERVLKTRGHSAKSSKTHRSQAGRWCNEINRRGGSQSSGKSGDAQKIRETWGVRGHGET